MSNWFTTSSTDSLSMILRFAMVIGAAVYVAHLVDSRVEKTAGLMASTNYGCEVPPRLINPIRTPEAAPTPKSDNPIDYIHWADNRLQQLHKTIQEANMDRRELGIICGRD